MQTPELKVVDATDMSHVYQDASFEILLDKGALDAVDLVTTTNRSSSSSSSSSSNEIINRCASEYVRIVKPGGYICIVSCRWPLERRLECFQNCPLQLQSVEVHKAAGQEQAPSGSGIFVLERMPDGFKFDLSQLDLESIKRLQETAYRHPEQINNQTDKRSCIGPNDDEATFEETDTILGILSATLESC
jgi:hypothetical protein